MQKILIIDDALFMLSALKEILGKDYNIYTIQDGAKALTAAKEIRPSLILLDIVMPRISGFDVIKELKSDQDTYDIPVIFLTGLSDEGNEEKGLELGAVDYITKPFSASIVSARVKTHIKLYLYQKQLEAWMLTDRLTGICNRRGYDEKLSLEWKNACFTKQPISLLMIDVDHFKTYNDNYGHQVGDMALHEVAQAVKNVLVRPTDTVARYGGEEFVVILPNTEEEGVRHIAEKILVAVSSRKIKHEFSPASDHITVSIGAVSVTPDKNMNIDEFVKTADVMMYTAKNNGRNTYVYSYGGTE